MFWEPSHLLRRIIRILNVRHWQLFGAWRNSTIFSMVESLFYKLIRNLQFLFSEITWLMSLQGSRKSPFQLDSMTLNLSISQVEIMWFLMLSTVSFNWREREGWSASRNQQRSRITFFSRICQLSIKPTHPTINRVMDWQNPWWKYLRIW